MTGANSGATAPLIADSLEGVGRGLPSMASPEMQRYQVVADYLHDMRTPLVALRGYAKMLQDERWGTLNQTQKDYLQTIVDNAQRLIQVLNEFSQVASMEPMAFRELNIRTLLNQTLSGWRNDDHHRSLTLEESDDLRNLYVWGDPAQLTEAFEELLTRAKETAAPEADISISLSQSDNSVQLRIATLPHSSSKRTQNPGKRQANKPVATPPAVRGEVSTAHAVVLLHGGQITGDVDEAGSITVVLPAHGTPA